MSLDSGKKNFILELQPVRKCNYSGLKARDISQICGFAEEDYPYIEISDGFFCGVENNLSVQKDCLFVYKPFYLDIIRDNDEETVRIQKSVRKALYIQKSLLDMGESNSSIVHGLLTGRIRKYGSYLMERSVIPEYGKRRPNVDFTGRNPYQNQIDFQSKIVVYLGINNTAGNIISKISSQKEIEIAGEAFHAKIKEPPETLNLNGKKLGVLLADLYLYKTISDTDFSNSFFRVGYDASLKQFYFKAGSTFTDADLKHIMEYTSGPKPYVLWLGQEHV